LALVLAWAGAPTAAAFERTILERDPQSACPATGQALAGAPQFVLLDERSGRYAMRWTGRDGTTKEIGYFCPNRVDVTIAAAVSQIDGKFRYTYEIRNGDSSGQSVYGVALQTFGSGARVLQPRDDRYVGTMNAAVIPEFAVGKWYRVPFSDPELRPGKSWQIVLESDAPPGLVNVRVHGGPLELEGVGEEPPSGLEAQLPRFAVWPRGITIGPVADMRAAEYPFARLSLSELIGELARAGWLTSEAQVRYKNMIGESGARALAASVERDVTNGNVAPEVRYALSLLQEAAQTSH
jgi:hypothetical protein